MRIAVSNIAWDTHEDDDVAQLLLEYAVDAIDVAPGKYFPQPSRATDFGIAVVREYWAQRGIEITGMQALLFGTTGLNVFGNPTVQQQMLEHLEAVSRIGAGLGAKRLVFGSPRNRDRSGLNDEMALNMAVSFFWRLGNIAKKHDVVFCLEPNPTCYGANFMTTTSETAQVVQLVNHPAIKMQFDSGAIFINAEDPGSILDNWADMIGHVHASEPELLPLGDCNSDHKMVHDALVKYLPGHLVTIEMLATKDEEHLDSIRRAIISVVSNYGALPSVGR